MLLVYIALVAIGYVARVVHEPLLRWARKPRPALELPRETSSRTPYERVLHSLDARDRATWATRERMPGDPP